MRARWPDLVTIAVVAGCAGCASSAPPTDRAPAVASVKQAPETAFSDAEISSAADAAKYSQTQAAFQELVRDHLGLKPEQVHPESDFVNDLGADSLDTVELMLKIEEHFQLEISCEDFDRMRSVERGGKYLYWRLQHPND